MSAKRCINSKDNSYEYSEGEPDKWIIWSLEELIEIKLRLE